MKPSLFAPQSPSSAVLRNILWRLILFIASIMWLSANAWGPSDIIWTFWCASLIGGYLVILSVIASGLYVRRTSTVGDEGLSLPGGAVLLLFFSLHFVGFHLVHAIFLELLFPLQPEHAGGPGSLLVGFDNLWICLQQYADFLILLLATKIPQLLEMLRARRAPSLQFAMSSPYSSVVTIHFTIFLLVGAQLLGVTGPAIAVFMVFYFMPAVGVIRSTIAEINAGRTG